MLLVDEAHNVEVRIFDDKVLSAELMPWNYGIYPEF
jgi:hypothetical protein